MKKTDRKEIEYIDISDEQLVSVNGGVRISQTAFNMVCNLAMSALLQIFQQMLPNFNWSDKGANFMSLIHEWAEYHYGINGKNENDPKCQAIIAVLKANGFSMEKILQAFKEAEKKVA